jgi:hypothetical protein
MLLGRAAILADVRRRKIEALYHFTRIENLPGILQAGLFPVDSVPDGLNVQVSDVLRLDGRLDCLSISISFPNHSMFYMKRRTEGGAWCVVQVEPSVLWRKSCMFFHRNAASVPGDIDRSKYRGFAAFKGIFGTEHDRPADLPLAYPLNVQAEVQVEGSVPLTLIRSVHFEDHLTLGRARATASNSVELTVTPSLFREREYALRIGRRR